MILETILCVFATPVCPSGAGLPGLFLAQVEEDVDKEIQAAGTDTAKLMALAEGYVEAKNSEAAEKVYQRVIELDSEHAGARAGLRHYAYAGQWFESRVALAAYQRKEAKAMEEKGLARFEDRWVPTGDVPYLTMGWRKDEQGGWVDPVLVARAQQVAEWKEAGYRFRPDDNSWVAPGREVEQWTNGLWKCGDEWLDMDKANQYHASIENSWELVGEHFVTWTSAPWETGNFARWHADQTYSYLVKIFGLEPATKPHFFVLPNLPSYNNAGSGSGDLLDVDGLSSLHGAYFSDLSFDGRETPMRYTGMGVCYWDRTNEVLDVWGPFWVRWAAAQSYVDAIDRSWNAIGPFVAEAGRGQPVPYGKAFWAEKRIPRWLRYGAASYVGDFLPNYAVAPEEDKWGLRAFSFSELKKQGGLSSLEDVFQFTLTVEALERSTRLYREAGLVVAFLMDGAPQDKELHAAHGAFRDALATGSRKELAKAVGELESCLLKREKAIRKFAGL